MSAYADTSLLVSLYVPDANSPAAADLMRRLSTQLLVTPLGELELLNALQLRVFRKEVSAAAARAANGAFRADLGDGVFAIRALSDDLFQHATQLVSRWSSRIGVRTLDIIHVAAAITLGAEAFCTFDDRQRKLARAAGLTVAR